MSGGSSKVRCVPFLAARDFLLAHRTDYAAAYARFSWPELAEFNWALDYFDVMAAGNNAPALWIVDEDGAEEKLSFEQLSQRSNQVANRLRDIGVARGDRILLMLGNQRELWETMLAAMKLGAVVVPATTLLAHTDLQDRFERGAVRHVITSSAHTSKFDSLPGTYTRIVVGAPVADWHLFDPYSQSTTFSADGPTLATDPLLLYFTSGTSTKPKLVLHSHESYPVGHLSTMYWIGLQPRDIHLNISSPGWAKHAWSSFFSPWNAGACVFIYNYGRFSATGFLNVLQTFGITVMCAPPTVWRMLIQADLGPWKVKLRELVSAGEPLNPEVIKQVQAAWGITIRDGYGQTETTCQIGNSPGQPLKPGSVGRPLPGYRVDLINSDDASDVEGEICLTLQAEARPRGLMLGYAKHDGAGSGSGDTHDAQADSATLGAMRGGYYHTGDIASRDNDGYYTYIGRGDDVFKSSDYRISPFELESVLIEHPAVAEAAVVPSPDSLRLSVPKAFIVLASGQPASVELAREIFAFCCERLAPYKRIRRIEFAELPKTVSGKIRRNELRAREAERRAAPSRNEMEFLEDDLRT